MTTKPRFGDIVSFHNGTRFVPATVLRVWKDGEVAGVFRARDAEPPKSEGPRVNISVQDVQVTDGPLLANGIHVGLVNTSAYTLVPMGDGPFSYLPDGGEKASGLCAKCGGGYRETNFDPWIAIQEAGDDGVPACVCPSPTQGKQQVIAKVN